MSQKEHFRALLRRLDFPDKQRIKLERNLASNTARQEAISEIERVRPGAVERVAAAWADNSGRKAAVHLYWVPAFDGRTHGFLRDQIKKRFNVSVPQGEWVPLASSRAGHHEDHVHRVRLSAKTISLVVRTYFEHRFQCNDGKNGAWAHQDIEIEVHYARRGKPMALAFGTTGQARRAILLALEELFGASIPTDRSPEQERWFIKTTFSDSLVKALAADLDLKHIVLTGPLRTQHGTIGTSVFAAPDGEKKVPLDPNDPLVKTRLNNPNDVLDFFYEFHHQYERYTEYVEVHFTVTADHPHVTFTRACTRAAKDHLLGALVNKIAG